MCAFFVPCAAILSPSPPPLRAQVMMYNPQRQIALCVLSNAYFDAPHDVESTSALLFDKLSALEAAATLRQ